MMTLEEARRFAAKIKERWDKNPDGRYDVETMVALVTQAGSISKVYSQVKVVAIDVESPVIEIEATVEIQKTRQEARVAYLIPVQTVVSFGDTSEVHRIATAAVSGPPAPRKIVA